MKRAKRASRRVRTGACYGHSANRAVLWRRCTYAPETFEEQPDVEVVIVPVGGGSGACGNCIVACARRRDEGHRRAGGRADAFARSFRLGARVVGESAKVREGMATRSPST